MANNKIWHILITSNSSSGVKEVHFSKAIAILIVTFIFIFIGVSATVTYLFVNNKMDQHKLRKLQIHNSKLKNEIVYINSVLDTLKINLEVLEKTDKKIRKLEGMKQIDDDIRKMGIGGNLYIDSTFIEYDEKLFSIHNELLRKIETMQRQLKFEMISYNEVEKFLEIKNTIYNHTPTIRPSKGRITSNYGYRIHPITKQKHFHHGTDIANKKGSYIYATADGKIWDMGYHEIYGKYIIIDHDYGYKTFYAHLGKRLVNIGEEVTKYQIIATIGNTGISNGYHLHYEVRFYGRYKNPINYFNKKKSTIFVDNKYLS